MRGVEYKGYNGTISVGDGELVVTHSGLVAKGGGLATGQGRRIPLPAISGVSFKEATRLTNGSLAFGLGGQEPAEHKATETASNPDAVMFRHKDNDAFRSLYEWLLTVVEYNRTHGVDPTSVPFDPAPPSRLQRLNARAEALAADAAASAEVKANVVSRPRTRTYGADRPDIIQAAARMGWRLGGGREIKKLAQHLHEDETVRFIVKGTYVGRQGILVLTDLRLLFLFHGWVQQAKEDFPLRLISSVQTRLGVVSGHIRIFVAGSSAQIDGIIKTDVEPLAQAVRSGMAEQQRNEPGPAPTPAQPVAPPADDPYVALERLAALRDSGVLTEEEFAAKKQEILQRL